MDWGRHRRHPRGSLPRQMHPLPLEGAVRIFSDDNVDIYAFRSCLEHAFVLWHAIPTDVDVYAKGTAKGSLNDQNVNTRY